MFNVNDKVFYGAAGICEIVDIAPPPIKGIKGNYYYLQPVYDSKGIIYSPVDNVKTQIRLIITEDEAQKLIKRAENCKKDPVLSEKLSPAKYDETVKSQDTLKLMHLVRALYSIKNERIKELRRMKSADSRLLNMSRKLLYGELAAALGKGYDEMSEELDRLLSVN